MQIDRRTMLAGASATAGLAMASPAFARALSQKPSLFIYDARFALSRDIAQEMAAGNVQILDPRELDLGVAWREKIPAMLSQNRAKIAGMTLWSDQFICESFGRDHGLTLRVSNARQAVNGAEASLQEWVLS